MNFLPEYSETWRDIKVLNPYRHDEFLETVRQDLQELRAKKEKENAGRCSLRAAELQHEPQVVWGEQTTSPNRRTSKTDKPLKRYQAVQDTDGDDLEPEPRPANESPPSQEKVPVSAN